MKNRMTPAQLRSAKGRGRPLTMITAYDYPSALIVDRSPVEMILVGDSLGNNVLGYEGTARVTMDEMLHHVAAVARGATHTMVIGDMPFGSYNVSIERTMEHADALIQAGADCVKFEGGAAFAETARALVSRGIAVIGHIGLTPQTVHPRNWRVSGRDKATAATIMRDAAALDKAGVSALVLEAVPYPLAAQITARVAMPTIGIAAGPHCDGQVMIWHDLLGLNDETLHHVKQYLTLKDTIGEALARYCTDVEGGFFPTTAHGYRMEAEELAAAIREAGGSPSIVKEG